MSKISALVAGSFDPVTIGHYDLFSRASVIFDRVYVTVFSNTEKKNMFTLGQRCEMLSLACKNIKNITVESSNMLLADYAAERGITVIVKGVRNSVDLGYEFDLATINRSLKTGLETVFIPALPEYMHVSSTFVRDMIKYNRSIDGWVPEGVAGYIKSVLHS